MNLPIGGGVPVIIVRKDDNISPENRSLLGEALMELCHSDVRDVRIRAFAALGVNNADAVKTLKFLVPLLKTAKDEDVEIIAVAIANYGAAARFALSDLFELLVQDRSNNTWRVRTSIELIGFDQKAAAQFCHLKIPSSSGEFLHLYNDFPDEAVIYLQNNPKAVQGATYYRCNFIKVMQGNDPKYRKLKAVLYESEHLPLRVMAELGDPIFLPRLEERIEQGPTPDPMLLACARACGRAPERVVIISETEEGDYKPQSAKPGGEFVPSENKSGDMTGFGGVACGVQEVIVTGNIQTENGTPISSAQFFRVNDSLRMGNRQRHPLDVRFNEETGRFVFFTTVGSCTNFSDDGHRTTTGSSMVSIEAKGCEPLVVRFYEGMPDVEITLSVVKPDPVQEEQN